MIFTLMNTGTRGANGAQFILGITHERSYSNNWCNQNLVVLVIRNSKLCWACSVCSCQQQSYQNIDFSIFLSTFPFFNLIFVHSSCQENDAITTNTCSLNLPTILQSRYLNNICIDIFGSPPLLVPFLVEQISVTPKTQKGIGSIIFVVNCFLGQCIHFLGEDVLLL